MRVRGEWEAERSGGRGIVVWTNEGFPPPVPQTRHESRRAEECDRGRKQFGARLERAEADSIDRTVNQSKDLPFIDVQLRQLCLIVLIQSN